MNGIAERRLQLTLIFFSVLTYCICFPLLAHLYWPDETGYNIRKQLFGDDFLNMWAGSRLYLEDKVALVFDPALYHLSLKDLLQNPDYPLHTFSYPPHLLMFVSWFGFMTYFQALLVWSLLGVAGLALLLKHLNVGWRWSAIILTSPIVMANLMMGQNGLFTGVLLFGGLILSRDRPIVAGLLFALLTMKPQLGLLIPVVLLLTRNWKCFLSASIGTCVLVGVSAAMLGIGAWQDYLSKTLEFQQRFITEFMGVATYYQFLMPGVYATGLLMDESLRSLFTGLHILIALLAFYKIVMVVHKDRQLEPKTILGICLASALITPYFFNYDMLAIILAATLFLIATVRDASARKINSFLWLVLMMLWTLPVSTIVMRGTFESGLNASLSDFFLFPPVIMVACFYALFFRKEKITD